MTWTTEMDTLLRKCAADGLSASQTGRRLSELSGRKVSSSAAISRGTRLSPVVVFRGGSEAVNAGNVANGLKRRTEVVSEPDLERQAYDPKRADRLLRKF